MDPVSEMNARELFEKKGLQVVGWYHSHPTFEPVPSIRDIQNQASYQVRYEFNCPYTLCIYFLFNPRISSVMIHPVLNLSLVSLSRLTTLRSFQIDLKFNSSISATAGALIIIIVS